jgi:DNA repair exonuclease SbcCD ATPase subunit
MDKIKINSFELENVKRIKAVQLEPSEKGLTIIGGDNAQGKTSVLDAIAWALGGNKYKPSKPTREGSSIPAALKIVLSNGIIVERKGKAGALKVTDPSGLKGTQGLLDSFINEFALDLPKFMQMNDKDKSATLLKVIGVGDQLDELEQKEKAFYQNRTETGRIKDRKKKAYENMPAFEEAPEALLDIKELLTKQQKIQKVNADNERIRQEAKNKAMNASYLKQKLDDIEKEYQKAKEASEKAFMEAEEASAELDSLIDIDTSSIEEQISSIEEINSKVRANFERKKAYKEYEELQSEYDDYTAALNEVKEQKVKLLDNADLPLEGLSVEEGRLTYLGQNWDNMSGSQQLKVATAICKAINPKCGFVLLDKLEQMDMKTLNEFGSWLEKEGLQAIATRVSQGDECSVIIEDGYIKKEEPTAEHKWEGVKW